VALEIVDVIGLYFLLERIQAVRCKKFERPCTRFAKIQQLKYHAFAVKPTVELNYRKNRCGATHCTTDKV